MNKPIHIHKYEKSKRKGIYRCAFASCAHYQFVCFLIGKWSICHLCGTEFELTAYDLKRYKPRCAKCKKGKRGQEQRQKELFVEELLGKAI